MSWNLLNLKCILHPSQFRAIKQELTESYTVLGTTNTDKTRLCIEEVYFLGVVSHVKIISLGFY